MCRCLRALAHHCSAKAKWSCTAQFMVQSSNSSRGTGTSAAALHRLCLPNKAFHRSHVVLFGLIIVLRFEGRSSPLPWPPPARFVR
mmetsp:Transcript_29148/g.61217  ORF Transcript_29148/g.61217 Transcript_29148/m.61217 type:complete len:86 (+) Transcript_29148:266-523(+)